VKENWEKGNFPESKTNMLTILVEILGFDEEMANIYYEKARRYKRVEEVVTNTPWTRRFYVHKLKTGDNLNSTAVVTIEEQKGKEKQKDDGTHTRVNVSCSKHDTQAGLCSHMLSIRLANAVDTDTFLSCMETIKEKQTTMGVMMKNLQDSQKRKRPILLGGKPNKKRRRRSWGGENASQHYVPNRRSQPSQSTPKPRPSQSTPNRSEDSTATRRTATKYPPELENASEWKKESWRVSQILKEIERKTKQN